MATWHYCPYCESNFTDVDILEHKRKQEFMKAHTPWIRKMEKRSKSLRNLMIPVLLAPIVLNAFINIGQYRRLFLISHIGALVIMGLCILILDFRTAKKKDRLDDEFELLG